MDFLLLIKMYFGFFSFKKKNMRFFSLKRLISFVIIIPLFTVLLIVNQFFLLLDYIFFFRFLNQKIAKSVFIVAVPRSGTTFLYHRLATDKEGFTAMKLWEIIFAPSVIQKKIVSSFIKFDKWMGKPCLNFIGLFEKRFLKDLNNIHQCGLGLPEEDEGILLWNVSTIYFHFFVPDTFYFDKYVFFDNQLSDKKKKRIMKYYYRCVQRHNFVFNRDGSKYYLAKNPVLSSKLKTLNIFFPDAFILNLIRDPGNTLPSTRSLNNFLFSFTSPKLPSAEMELRTRNALIFWSKMTHKNLNNFESSRVMKISFKVLVSEKSKVIEEIYHRIGINSKEKYASYDKKLDYKSSNYVPLSKEENTKVLMELPFLKEFI